MSVEFAHALPGVSEATRSARERLVEIAGESSRILVIGSRGRIGGDLARVLHAATGAGQLCWVACTGVPDLLVAREVDSAGRDATLVIADTASLGPRGQEAVTRRERLVVGLSDVESEPTLDPDVHWDRVRLPDLRESAGDIPILISHLLGRIDELVDDGRTTSVSADVLSRLATARWIGVDELEQALVRLRVFGESSLDVRAGSAPTEFNAPLTLDEVERRTIERALQRCGGVQTRAARSLGVSERALRYKLAKHGLGSARTGSPERTPTGGGVGA